MSSRKYRNKRRKAKNGGNGNKNVKANDVENTLKWHMKNFVQPCEVCHNRNVVHAFRKKGKYSKAVRTHCGTKGCTEHMNVITCIEAFGADACVMACEVCKSKMEVIGSRRKAGMHKEAVYAVCTNEECRERSMTFCYIGAKIGTKRKLNVTKRSRPPIFLVQDQERAKEEYAAVS